MSHLEIVPSKVYDLIGSRVEIQINGRQKKEEIGSDKESQKRQGIVVAVDPISYR